MLVLVTGGAGYIGSHTVLELLSSGYEVLVADNFVNSKPAVLARLRRLAGREIPFVKAELCNSEAVDRLFCEHEIHAVIHFAGLKAVGESVAKPLEYYSNNLISTLNILKAMRRHGVQNIVFSSSATVYGDPASVPITEDFPLSATNPYGRTKLMIEEILRDLHRADSAFNIALLRYFNPIGAHDSGLIGEDPFGVPNNLLPYVAQVAVGRLPFVSVYGHDYPTADGTGVRDYIHVCDLATGHVAALKALEKSCGLLTCNLGTGVGYSVLEVITAFSRACGREIPFKFADRRPGDIAQCYADCSFATSALGWRATRSLDDMCRDSWRWQSGNPNGYDE
ncbi:MAG: UDP-glucose 4-epimerase GalE [Oscillospiraceae bacterium]